MVNKVETIVVGAGLSGLNAAYHLTGGFQVHEQNKNVGGLARSRVIDGFTFDYAPHILFIQDKSTLPI